MVIKVKPGPALGSKPAADNAGKIINPASTHTIQDRITTHILELAIPLLSAK